MPRLQFKGVSHPNLPIVLGLFVALYFTFPTLKGAFYDWNLLKQPSWEGVFPDSPEARTKQVVDVDTWLIHHGVTAAPTIRDTLKWWHGTWAGTVPFYRPISSYAFWVEWKLFGNYEARYVLLSVTLHLLAVWQFLLLSRTLFLHFRCPMPGVATLLSGLLFIQGLGVLGVRYAAVGQVYAIWKNMPESIVTLFYCLALRSYLVLMDSCGRGDTPGSSPIRGIVINRVRIVVRSAAPTIWYLTCCASKEAGILMPLLLICLELHEIRVRAGEWRRTLLRLAPVLIALPTFVVLRTLFLGTFTGFRYGSNGSWIARLTDDLIGAAGHDLRTGRYGPVMIGLCLVLAADLTVRILRQPNVQNRKRQIINAALISTTVMVACSVFINVDMNIAIRPVVFLIEAFDSGWAREGLGIAIMFIGIINVFRYRPALGVFGYCWVLSSLMLLMFTPSAIHRDYLLEGGFAIMIAAGLTTWRSSTTIQATASDSPTQIPNLYCHVPRHCFVVA